MRFRFQFVFHYTVVLSMTVACSKPVKTAAQEIKEDTVVHYTESTEDFPNPERGFYRYSETSGKNPRPLNPEDLKKWRAGAKADNGNYHVISTLVFRYYILDAFKESALSAGFLTHIQADFQIARSIGVKLIPRFTYTNSGKSGNCPEQFICPPYGDVNKTKVLEHIAQLKSVLSVNADVIACVQMGFIGIWGEQYYTDHFGDASANGAGKLVDSNWNDRIEVLRAILDAVPSDRMIQVRYPQIKQRLVYGVHAATNVAPLTETEAFSGTDKARIGYHNDCFLASTDDYGTYEDYGNSVSDRTPDLNILKEFKKKDSRYVVVGGETCTDDYSPQNDCEPAGIAQTEMENLHYSFLNCAYNNEVNNDWQTGGCMDAIRKRLGYRFVLKSVRFPRVIEKSDPLRIKIELLNRGYASCYNERPVNLVFRNKLNGQKYSVAIDADPRKWYSGNISIETTVSLPAGISSGDYEVYLFLPDKYTSIAERPEYAIRLANNNLWDSSTGMNKLNLSVKVK